MGKGLGQGVGGKVADDEAQAGERKKEKKIERGVGRKKVWSCCLGFSFGIKAFGTSDLGCEFWLGLRGLASELCIGGLLSESGPAGCFLEF